MPPTPSALSVTLLLTQMYHRCHKCVATLAYGCSRRKLELSHMRRDFILPLLVACLWSSCAQAQGQFSDNKLLIGVMGDQSGVVSDVGGRGSIVAAKMAIEDAGGTVDGVPIEVITADHQNKPDV